jgi:hypothetical protein
MTTALGVKAPVFQTAATELQAGALSAYINV